jgi:hypothetical protein
VDSEGKVTAVAPGTATITVTTEDSGYTASCTVTVTGNGTAAISINLWFDEMEGRLQLNVHDNDDNIFISRSDNTFFDIKVDHPAATNIQAYVLGIPILADGDGKITIRAADYNSGQYSLVVVATINGIPYSSEEIAFSVGQ